MLNAFKLLMMALEVNLDLVFLWEFVCNITTTVEIKVKYYGSIFSKINHRILNE